MNKKALILTVAYGLVITAASAPYHYGIPDFISPTGIDLPDANDLIFAPFVIAIATYIVVLAVMGRRQSKSDPMSKVRDGILFVLASGMGGLAFAPVPFALITVLVNLPHEDIGIIPAGFFAGSFVAIFSYGCIKYCYLLFKKLFEPQVDPDCAEVVEEPRQKKSMPQVTVNGVNPIVLGKVVAAVATPKGRAEVKGSTEQWAKEACREQVLHIQEYAQGAWTCAHCGAENPVPATKCSKCESDQRVWTCGACGTTGNVGSYCDCCGNPFDEDDTVTAGGTPNPAFGVKPVKSILTGVWLTLILLLASVLITEWILYGQPVGPVASTNVLPPLFALPFWGVTLLFAWSSFSDMRAYLKNRKLMKRMDKNLAEKAAC